MIGQYDLVVTKLAWQYVLDIGDYISYTLEQPDIAGSFVHALREQIATLKSLPFRYGVSRDPVLAAQSIRCMPYKNYYVFYEIDEEENRVWILRIGYNRRNWKEILLK